MTGLSPFGPVVFLERLQCLRAAGAIAGMTAESVTQAVNIL